MDGRAANVETHLVDPNMTVLNFCQAMANILYAYAGHWMYFEIMAEMAQPVDFPKVFIINEYTKVFRKPIENRLPPT